jgi:hypothetical protein
MAMMLLLAVFAGATYAATKPPSTLKPPRVRSTSADLVLECPSGPPTIQKTRYVPVHYKVRMTRVNA